MPAHSPRQQFKEARQIAFDHGMFVVDKGAQFLLYRRTPTRPAFLGKCASAQALRALVCRCANFI